MPKFENFYTLDDYLDAARAATGATSDYALPNKLSFIKPRALKRWRQRKDFPPDEVIAKLARLVGVPPSIALAQARVWRATLERDAYNLPYYLETFHTLSAIEKSRYYKGLSLEEQTEQISP